MSSRGRVEWSRLENAAKIFPPTSGLRDTKVFRFACELREPVDRELLQKALDRTLPEYPFYRSIMKRGLFWYYLEATSRPVTVEEEGDRACAPLYDGDRKSLLFRVSFRGCRLNLEVYHAISDGTGALHFLRLLVCHYLALAHGGGEELPPGLEDGSSRQEKQDDSFRRYYRKSAGYRGRTRRAWRFSGEYLPDYRLGVIEGCTSVKAALALAKGYGCTLTVLMVALFIRAIHEEMPLSEQGRPVVISVPVNLRNFYPSASARNFFSTMEVEYDFSQGPDTLEAVVEAVAQGFRRELSPERVEARMNHYSAMEHNMLMRAIPLPLKDLVMRRAVRRSEATITGAFSNVGKIRMPAALAPYIRRFDVFSSTRRLQICMCSFEDELTISFTSPFVSAGIPRSFFRSLARLGLEVEISTNRRDEEERLQTPGEE